MDSLKKALVKDLNEIRESKGNIICEMANLPKRITGLPVDLWIDDNGDARKVKHKERRIKFQREKGEPVFPISVTDDPKILVNKQTKLSGQELKQIKEFIRTHKVKIEKIMNPNDEYVFGDFYSELKHKS